MELLHRHSVDCVLMNCNFVVSKTGEQVQMSTTTFVASINFLLLTRIQHFLFTSVENWSIGKALDIWEFLKQIKVKEELGWSCCFIGSFQLNNCMILWKYWNFLGNNCHYNCLFSFSESWVTFLRFDIGKVCPNVTKHRILKYSIQNYNLRVWLFLITKCFYPS